MGERPTHPELLDWLADEFVAQRLEHEAVAPADRDLERRTGSRRRFARMRRRSIREPAAVALPARSAWMRR